jgi:hypothetical protein
VAPSFGSVELCLSLCLMALGLWSLWIDREWLDIWALPPALWCSSVCIFAGGVGPLLLWISDSEHESGGLVQMQLGMLVGHLAFFLVYRLVRPNPRRCPSIPALIDNRPHLRALLKGGGIILLAFGVTETIVSAVSGVADRGQAGEAAAAEVFGYWTYFLAFQRLTLLAFLLAPLVWRFSGGFGRLYVLVCGVFILSVNVASGARYTTFSPLVLLVVGHIAFSNQHRIRMEVLSLGFLPLFAFGFVMQDHFRNTQAFHESTLANPLSRLNAVSEARDRAREGNANTAYLIGERLVGNIDALIYQATPLLIPFAGNDGIEALRWLYVPAFFSRDRPSLVDGNRIGELYLQKALVRTSVGPSICGDWYRRFGWLGVVVGMGLCGLIFGLTLQWVASNLRVGSLLSICILFSAATLATKDANMTVSTATWLYFYEFPKYYGVLAIIFKAGSFIGRIERRTLVK